MAARSRYLVAYDIREPARLRRVHEVVLDFGDMLQYSVYVCDLTKLELTRLRSLLRAEMNTEVDSVSIYDLGPPEGRTATRVEHLGPPPSVSPASAPEIW